MMKQAGGRPSLEQLMLDFVRKLSHLSNGESLALLNQSGLTLPQVITLHILRDHGDCSISELADVLRLSRAASSHLAERLVQKNLVLRVEDETDRRHKRVSITTRGASLTTKLDNTRFRAMEHSLSVLSADTRLQLLTAIERAFKELLEHAPCQSALCARLAESRSRHTGETHA